MVLMVVGMCSRVLGVFFSCVLVMGLLLFVKFMVCFRICFWLLFEFIDW